MILVGGENLMDMIQVDNQYQTALFKAIPGGSPYNLALAAGRQGVRVGYVTPISEDTSGDQLVANLLDSNVQLLGPRVPEPTSLAMVSIEGGTPSYTFYREGTAERLVTVDNLTKNLTGDVAIFHIGSLALTGGSDALVWEEVLGKAMERLTLILFCELLHQENVFQEIVFVCVFVLIFEYAVITDQVICVFT